MTNVPKDSEPKASPNPAPRYVLLREEARLRGFRNVLSFRRWCRRHEVPICADGRLQWVSPEDVDAAVALLSAQRPPSSESPTLDVDPVAAAVADLMMHGRGRR